MIGHGVVEPCTLVDGGIGGLGRGQEGKVGYHLAIIFHYHCSTLLHVAEDGLLARVAVNPLVGIAGLAHHLLGSGEHLHDALHIAGYRMSNYSHGKKYQYNNG